MIFLTNLGFTGILCRFDLVLEGKAGTEIPELARLEFSANNFTLSNTKDNTSGPFSREGRVDLPLLRTLLVIWLTSSE